MTMSHGGMEFSMATFCEMELVGKLNCRVFKFAKYSKVCLNRKLCFALFKIKYFMLIRQLRI